VGNKRDILAIDSENKNLLQMVASFNQSVVVRINVSGHDYGLRVISAGEEVEILLDLGPIL
jgi:hypothetical protein